MLGVTDLTTFVLGTIAIVLLPGPNSLYVLSLAAQRGIRAGYRGAFGIFAGDTILMTLSAGGMASLLHAQPSLFYVVKYAGAAYLGWVGVSMLIGAWRSWRGTTIGDAPDQPVVDTSRPFGKALLISLLNPKAILFCISFFIQFVDPAYPHPALSFLLLGSIIQICSLTYLSVLIFSGARLATAFRRRRRLAAGTAGSVGVMFVGFGAKLATATLK